MRKISINQATEGMCLAKSIYLENGVALLSVDNFLTDEYIKKIMASGIDIIYIKDALSSGARPNEAISEETERAISQEFFKYLQTVNQGHYIISQSLIETVTKVVTEVITQPKVLVGIQQMRSRSDKLYAHSVTVCILSVILGEKLGLKIRDLQILALGALFHDIGKLKIDRQLWCKLPDQMTKAELREYKKHPQYGYQMIYAMDKALLPVAIIALSHHEYYNGNGFPLAKKGKHISLFSRIVAVVANYDRLLFSDKQLKQYMVIELIVSKAYDHFDPDIIQLFSETVVPFPVGTGILLNDGRKGLVMKLHEGFPTRPLIKLVGDQKQEHELVDLTKQLNLFIMDEIDIEG